MRSQRRRATQMMAALWCGGWQHPPDHQGDRGKQPYPPWRAISPKHHTQGLPNKARGVLVDQRPAQGCFSVNGEAGVTRWGLAFLYLDLFS